MKNPNPQALMSALTSLLEVASLADSSITSSGKRRWLDVAVLSAVNSIEECGDEYFIAALVDLVSDRCWEAIDNHTRPWAEYRSEKSREADRRRIFRELLSEYLPKVARKTRLAKLIRAEADSAF